MNIDSSQLKRFAIIFILGFLSGLPLSLFATSLQAWFTQAGYSVEFVSQFGYLYFGFFIRILIGPFMDKFFYSRLGRRKSWILMSQICLFFLVEALAFCQPLSNLHLMITLSIFLTFMTAINDMAIDAHRIEYCKQEQYGSAAVIAVYGYRLALMLSGGGLLLMAHYTGFQIAYACIGVFFLLGALLVLRTEEPSTVAQHQHVGFWKPYQLIMQSPWCYSMMGLIFCIKFGEVFVSNSSILIIPFMMKGLGLGLPQIAFLNKVLGLVAQFLGCAVAAFLIYRFSLMSLLLNFGIFLAICNFGFSYLSLNPTATGFMYLVIFAENLASGLCTTVMVAILMRIVNPSFTASQFSFWIILGVFPRLFAVPLVTHLFPQLGWSGLFLFSALICLGFIIFWLKLRAFTAKNIDLQTCFSS